MNTKNLSKNIVLAMLFLFAFQNLFSQNEYKRLYSLAIKETQAHHYRKANAYYSEIIKIYPKDSMVYFDRAMNYTFMNKPRKAIRDFTKQIEIDSLNLDAFFLRGIEKIKIKKYKSALIDLLRMLKDEAANADAHYYAALCYLKLKDNVSACNSWNQYLRLGGDLKNKLGKFCK